MRMACEPPVANDPKRASVDLNQQKLPDIPGKLLDFGQTHMREN
jgi:hypothetical protein